MGPSQFSPTKIGRLHHETLNLPCLVFTGRMNVPHCLTDRQLKGSIMTTIAVTGATGQLGQWVIAQLKQRVADDQLIALVRNLAKAAGLGVTAEQDNYAQPEALDAALLEVDTLALFLPAKSASAQCYTPM